MNEPCFSVSILLGRSLDARLDEILCLQKCFDIMEIMYSFVAANRVRQSSQA